MSVTYAYLEHKQKMDALGLTLKGIPFREVSYWDEKLSVFQKEGILRVAGYAGTDPNTRWGMLIPRQREVIKNKIRNDMLSKAAFLGMRFA